MIAATTTSRRRRPNSWTSWRRRRLAKVERNTLLAIFWALGCEEHAVENDDEESTRVAGESARKLAREYLGEIEGDDWCKIKHYGLSYVNAVEQIGKKMRRGEDWSHLADHRDIISSKVNDLVEEILGEE